MLWCKNGGKRQNELKHLVGVKYKKQRLCLCFYVLVILHNDHPSSIFLTANSINAMFAFKFIFKSILKITFIWAIGSVAFWKPLYGVLERYWFIAGSLWINVRHKDFSTRNIYKEISYYCNGKRWVFFTLSRLHLWLFSHFPYSDLIEHTHTR